MLSYDYDYTDTVKVSINWAQAECNIACDLIFKCVAPHLSTVLKLRNLPVTIVLNFDLLCQQ